MTLDKLAASRDEIKAVVEHLTENTITPLEGVSNVHQVQLDKINEEIIVLNEKAEGNAKTDSLLAMMEEKIAEQGKKMKEENMRDLEQFKEEQLRKSEMDNKAAASL